jgi:hypothetical protein
LALKSWRAGALAAAAVAALTTLGIVAIPASGSTAAVKPPISMLKSIHQSVLNKKLVAGAAKAPNGISTFTSGNWAGYLALPSGPTTSFKKIQADFTVPSVNCNGGGVGTGDAFAYHWVGLDGWSDGTVEQDGVADFCEGGSALYYAWWETYPGGINLVTTVNPGDQVTATVTYNGSDYVMTVDDITQGTDVVNVTEPCESGSTCDNSTAEDITEGYRDLPWLGTVDYGRSLYDAVIVTNQAGTTGGIADSNWSDGMVEAIGSVSGHLTSLPGDLYSAGNGTKGRSAFEIVWKGVD